MLRDKIDRQVHKERSSQDNKWGVQNHCPRDWIIILMEEVGEVSSAIMNRDWVSYREELIQVAAVSKAMLEALDRE